MRILVAHNRYQYSGGEDSVMEAEVNMLRRAGNDVLIYEADNALIHGFRAKAHAAVSIFSSAHSYRSMAARLASFAPDVVHIHNWFPLLSPSIISACVDAGIPVVQTLHNFRMICANANLYRDRHICLDCVGKLVPIAPAVHGCYRDSHIGSAAIVAAFAFHRLRGTWKGVTTFIAVSNFQRSLLIQGGMDANQIVVKPNFVSAPTTLPALRGDHALFVGRLVEEKGIRTVLRCWESEMPGLRLRIVGDGPLRHEVTDRATSIPDVAVLGQRSHAQVLAEMAAAKVVVFPSESAETFALTIVESFSVGTPVIAATQPSVLSLVREAQTGYLFTPGDARELADTLRLVSTNPDGWEAMQAKCIAAYRCNYTEARNYDLLTSIYADAIRTVRDRQTAATTVKASIGLVPAGEAPGKSEVAG